MQNTPKKIAVFSLIAVGTLVAGMSVTTAMESSGESSDLRDIARAYIVQGKSLDGVSRAVTSVNARVTRELGIIDAVVVELTIQQREKLRSNRAVYKIVADRTAAKSSSARSKLTKAGV